MTRPNPIDIAASGRTPIGIVTIILGARREVEVHEVSDGGLATAAVGVSNCSLVGLAGESAGIKRHTH